MANDPNNLMAQVQATLAQLQAKLATVRAANINLTNQINTLQAAAATAATAPTAATVVVTFALTPATSNLTGLLDYSSKLGGPIYKEGCKKLTDDEGFAMTPATTAAFVKVFANCCNVMGWNQGTKQRADHHPPKLLRG